MAVAAPVVMDSSLHTIIFIKLNQYHYQNYNFHKEPEHILRENTRSEKSQLINAGICR